MMPVAIAPTCRRAPRGGGGGGPGEKLLPGQPRVDIATPVLPRADHRIPGRKAIGMSLAIFGLPIVPLLPHSSFDRYREASLIESVPGDAGKLRDTILEGHDIIRKSCLTSLDPIHHAIDELDQIVCLLQFDKVPRR